MNYLRGNFTVDFLYTAPIMFYEIILGFPTDESTMEDLADNDILFNILMNLKLLRFVRIKQVTQSLVKLVNIIADIFYMKRVLFNNLMRWMLAALKLILSIHVFACGWTCIAKIKESSGGPGVEFEYDTIFGQYVSSFYMTTTTITTVGYGHGNYKGFIDTSGHWTAEMIYLFFLQFVGIVLFSLVTHEIFSY